MNINNNVLEIITTKKDWNSLLQEIGNYDFYHTYDYHTIEMLDHQNPILLKYTENDNIIALPLLIRKIVGTDYFDATSVYGYAGPISKILNDFDNKRFIKKLHAYFIENKIVSVFSRLNPFINQQKEILKNYGEVINQGKVININLKLSQKLQREGYQKRLKTHINKCRRNCFIKKIESQEDLREFIEIYRENMKRVNAEEYYYFDEDYFYKMTNSTDFKTEILFAIDKKLNTVIAGSMFVITNGIVQYHLSGRKSEFLHLTPAKLLIDEMRILSTQQKRKFFNLGGGLGGSDEDSLFRFKSSFSKNYMNFNLWKLIVNQEIYDELVAERKITTETSYFPKYRFLDKK